MGKKVEAGNCNEISTSSYDTSSSIFGARLHFVSGHRVKPPANIHPLDRNRISELAPVQRPENKHEGDAEFDDET